ncbi:hypothetical protein M9H77_22279 [Catharanthus roseus]|uniref:Uncharacterized protein n=1 Tax=Catharanthus roseus TaxID=4058 RepID=A0ACC0AU24_CATRO|nr:hypothetical protein M9H77_22279 [Catharanthus roseus]
MDPFEESLQENIGFEQMATSGNWQLFVHNGRHNHKIVVYNHGHAQSARLTEEQLQQTKQFRKSHVPPRNILRFFREQDVGFAVRYNMPLLEYVGMTPTGKNFTVATAFICNKQATAYRWVLQQIKHLYFTSAMSNGQGSAINEGEPIIMDELKKARQMVKEPGSNCLHYLRKLHGLPCACELVNRCRHLMPIQEEDVVIFWRKLEISSDIPEEHRRDMESEMRNLTSLLQEISTGPISNIWEVRRLIKGVIHPVLPDDPCQPLSTPPPRDRTHEGTTEDEFYQKG